ncbi:MAG TPA: sigma 54-interacting response regulator [Puia sp.]|nr:sigma 54-interacting response regulator [Puia sp.]
MNLRSHSLNGEARSKEKILIVEDQFVEANDLRMILEKAGYAVCGIARSVPKALEILKEEKPGLVLLDIFLKGKLTGIDLARHLREENIAFVYISANSNEDILAAAKATEPYGFLVKPFREKDVLVALEIARYRHEHSLESKFRREALLQKQILRIMAEPISGEQKWLKMGKALQPYIPFEYMELGFSTVGEPPSPVNALGFLRIGFDEYQVIGANELMIITNLKMHELDALYAGIPADGEAAWYDEPAFKKICRRPSVQKLIADTFEMRSHFAQPLPLPKGGTCYFYFYSRRPDAYNADHAALFGRLRPSFPESISRVTRDPSGGGDPMTPGVSTAPASSVVRTAPVSSAAPAFEGIIGSSHLLLNVFDQITQVACSDTSALILGESGTGKERIADCIHRLSPRKGRAFVTVNCATLPATLIESELFGHEKGAFTGATDRRIGKFEQAAEGTIFLDEIGEMPVELQVKLLRVLQEKEIERIGSVKPTRVNVRIIAATNRNLEKEVAAGRFRLDLYYRLNVFPIVMPPLRERKEDIPLLLDHFINCYNRKAGKKITGVSEKVLRSLMAYNWPGNIRELEHLIERSVLLTKGSLIEDISLPLAQRREVSAEPEEGRIKTIHENERDHIITVLRKCNGKIWGAGGAAELLNVPPTTLSSKMKKLGIKRVYDQ